MSLREKIEALPRYNPTVDPYVPADMLQAEMETSWRGEWINRKDVLTLIEGAT